LFGSLSNSTIDLSLTDHVQQLVKNLLQMINILNLLTFAKTTTICCSFL